MSKCANGGVRAPAKQGLTHKTHHRTKRRGVQVSRVSETDLLIALHYSRNQLATPRRWLPHITASYTLNAAGKRRIGKRNNAVLRKYYDVVAMTPDVVALRPKPSTNVTWDEDLAAARRDPC